MPRIIFISLIISLTIGCKRESPFAVLSGKVYYYGIAIPVKDVRVKVDQNITFSGSDGSYSLEDIRKGVYMLRAEKEGFEPFYYEREFLDDIIYQNIEMTSEIFTHSISGRLFGDYAGKPRTGMRCVLMNPNGTESRLEAFSDSLGFYEIKRVPAGYHSFKVFDDDNLIYKDWIEVENEDISYDIVFPDIFSFEDARDGKEYSALEIDSLKWMIENLAYLPYVNDISTVSAEDKMYYVYGYEWADTEEAKMTDPYNKYGVLYNWRAALTACPDGWRLPTDEEWINLEIFLGMDELEAELDDWRNSGDIGTKLKDSTDWQSIVNTNNSSWFSALPGGYIGYDGGSFSGGLSAAFWTSTRCSENEAWSRQLSDIESGIRRLCNYTRHGYSVRCVR